jgi:hypothetical protein
MLEATTPFHNNYPIQLFKAVFYLHPYSRERVNLFYNEGRLIPGMNGFIFASV